LRKKEPFVEVKRLITYNLLGHSSRVKCIAIAPGEKEFVSCSNEDASVTLSNLQTGKEMGIFTGHQDTVINAMFSSDGKYLATTSRDHTMILWDVVTAKQLLTFDHAKVVICCCFSRDSKYIATGCQDKVCRLWETRRGREVLFFSQHEGIIINMAYAPDSTHICSASADKTVRMWSTVTGKCKFVLTGHAGIVLSVSYSNDGKSVISNDEKLLKVWNAEEGNCTLTVNVDELHLRLKRTISPGTPYIASGTTAPSNKKLTWTLSCAAPGLFTQYFLVACNNRFLYLMDITTGEEVSNVFCKAPVYCLSSGFKSHVAFGDSFGNIYVVRME
jgi:WD40 repeat protein